VHDVPPRQRITPSELRRYFNDGRYWERAKAGELRMAIVSDKRCPLESEPLGTRSQIIAYFDGSQKVAVVHQYLRPDGTGGASGRPDPKQLRVGDCIYYA
jgi:hypothetical protein